MVERFLINVCLSVFGIETAKKDIVDSNRKIRISKRLVELSERQKLI